MSPASDPEPSFEEFLQFFQASIELSEKKRPDKHTNRAAWNAHCELEISFEYSSYARNPSITRQFPELARNVRESDLMDLNQNLALLIKHIIVEEEYLVARVLDEIVYGPFESEWAALDVNRREELVLEGLYRAACAPLPEQSRLRCPEATVSGLAGDGEYSLIRMVRVQLVFQVRDACSRYM